MVRKYIVHSNTLMDVAIVPWESAYDSAMVCTNDQLIIIGGKTIIHDDYVSLVQSVNINTGGTKTLNPLKSPRSGMTAIYFNNEVYMFGGKDVFGVLRTVEK